MKTSRIDGLSMLESLIVLSILATGLTIAVPSWNDAKSKRELVGASEELSMFLASGRSLAVKHNRDVVVSLVYQDSTHWCVGLSETGKACDCTSMNKDSNAFCAIGGAQQTMSAEDLPRVAMTAHSDDTAFAFDRVRGTLASADVGDPHYFNFVSANRKNGLQVGISVTGSTFICSWLSNENLPAYRACESAPDDSGSYEGALVIN